MANIMPSIDPIAYVEFTDGTRRSVYVDSKGRQFILDDDGQRVYGYWHLERDETAADTPLIVTDEPF